MIFEMNYQKRSRHDSFNKCSICLICFDSWSIYLYRSVVWKHLSKWIAVKLFLWVESIDFIIVDWAEIYQPLLSRFSLLVNNFFWKLSILRLRVTTLWISNKINGFNLLIVYFWIKDCCVFGLSNWCFNDQNHIFQCFSKHITVTHGNRNIFLYPSRLLFQFYCCL